MGEIRHLGLIHAMELTPDALDQAVDICIDCIDETLKEIETTK